MLENYSLDDGGDVELENKEITNYANKSMNESTSKLLTPIKTALLHLYLKNHILTFYLDIMFSLKIENFNDMRILFYSIFVFFLWYVYIERVMTN